MELPAPGGEFAPSLRPNLTVCVEPAVQLKLLYRVTGLLAIATVYSDALAVVTAVALISQHGLNVPY